MGSKRTNGGRETTTTDVDTFMAHVDHPRKADIEAIRTILRGADPRIQERIKWNAPSFAIMDHFATLKLHPRATVQVVFYTGAKRKPTSTVLDIADPVGLLEWVAPDRGVVTFADMPDITRKQGALIAIVQQWVAQVEGDA